MNNHYFYFLRSISLQPEVKRKLVINMFGEVVRVALGPIHLMNSSADVRLHHQIQEKCEEYFSHHVLTMSPVTTFCGLYTQCVHACNNI